MIQLLRYSMTNLKTFLFTFPSSHLGFRCSNVSVKVKLLVEKPSGLLVVSSKIYLLILFRFSLWKWAFPLSLFWCCPVHICNLSLLFIFLCFRLLLVGGCETAEVGISKAASCGLSAWRVLSGSPYYKPVTHGGDRVTAVSLIYGISFCSFRPYLKVLDKPFVRYMEKEAICLKWGKWLNTSEILGLLSNIKFI